MYEVEIWLEAADQRYDLPPGRQMHKGATLVTTMPKAISTAITWAIPRTITRAITWAIPKGTRRAGLVSFSLLCLAMSPVWAQEKAQQTITRGTRASAPATKPQTTGAANANHLVGEKSPYLLLHNVTRSLVLLLTWW